MSSIVMFALGCGVLGVVYSLITASWVIKQDAGSARMQAISAAVQEGAEAFLAREYKTVAMVGIVIFGLLFFIGTWSAIGFAVGLIGSALAGYIGMMVSVRANVRTTQAATRGLQAALSLAFKGGSVTGVIVVGLGILGIAGFYAIAKAAAPEQAFHALVGLGFGCSLMSVFARIAGGIYTKAADVGADLVGKVEAGIPEDDPRNPAVIADNVGDNVGDCAGMAADLYETYTVTLVAAMLLAKTIFGADSPWVEFPLLLGGVSIIASIIGTYAVKLGANNYIMGALYKGLAVAGVLAAVAFYGVTSWFMGQPGLDAKGFTPMSVFLTAVIGLVLTGLIVWITELLHRQGVPAGAGHRQGQPDRPRHQRHRRPGDEHGGHRGSGRRDRRVDPRRLRPRRRLLRQPRRRPLRDRALGRVDALDDRHRRRDRLLRPDHRQRRRHRRDGRAALLGA